ncbi:MAG: hypothetical protein ACREBZ_02800 [Thermoplasmata archaeon]
MAREQIHLIVRTPLADLEEDIRRKYTVQSKLTDVAIEQDAIVFTFEGAPHKNKVSRSPSPAHSAIPEQVHPVRKRRKRRVRNRMKTRGWDVVGKFVNRRGQSCTIYRPFYDALNAKKLKRREAFSLVKRILVSNSNDPRQSSVEYFLDNTLEYIASRESADRAPASAETMSQ